MTTPKIFSVGLRRAILVTLLAAFCSCFEDGGQYERLPPLSPDYGLCVLTVEEAESVFDSEREWLSASGSGASFNCFCFGQDIDGVDWPKAFRVSGRMSENDNVQAPFSSRYRLQFFVRDRRGKAVFLDASQRMVVVRDSESGASGAFIMTMVSDRAYTKGRRGVDIGSRFHNDGNLADYSGLILYTSLSGAIVRADRYSGGSIQLWVSFQGVRSDGDLRERAAALAEVMGGTHVRRLASSARTRSSVDDSTGADASGSFGWYDQIDSASVCTGVADDDSVFCLAADDHTADWDSWLPDDYWDSLLAESYCIDGRDVPDPGCGGGGGSCVDYYGDSASGNESVRISGKTIEIKYGSSISAVQKSVFKEMLADLVADKVMVKVLADINPDRVSSITVKPSKDFQSYESGETIVTAVINSKTGVFLRYEVRIELNINGTLLGYIEEFFYADQFTNAVKPLVNFEGRICYGDVEFEAKAFCAQWIHNVPSVNQKSLGLLINDNYDYFNAIRKYVDNPDSGNRNEAISAFVRMGYQNFLMSDDGKNLDNIMQTYYKYFPKYK